MNVTLSSLKVNVSDVMMSIFPKNLFMKVDMVDNLIAKFYAVDRSHGIVLGKGIPQRGTARRQLSRLIITS